MHVGPDFIFYFFSTDSTFPSLHLFFLVYYNEWRIEMSPKWGMTFQNVSLR